VYSACDAAILLLLAWGALAFGAVYPWAYRPLAIGCGLVGLTGLLLSRENRPPIVSIAFVLGLLVVAIGLQLVPLSRLQLSQVSPATIRFLTQYDLGFPLSDAPHPLSIAPEKTTLGLLLVVTLALFLLGVARVASHQGAQRLVVGVLSIGAVLAIFGIVQEAINLSNRIILVYGFWKPLYEGSRPFGPFINRNHFAGWMLMALPVALGYVYATVERMWRQGSPGAHGRISLFGSSSGGRLLLLIFICATMFMSVLMTRSRSGIAAVAVEALLAGSMVIVKQTSTLKRVITAGVFLVVVGATAAWAGGETIVGRLVRPDSNVSSAGGRFPIWHDTLTIIRDFPLWGSGLDTYGTATIVYQSGPRQLHNQEAHNDYLQLASEGGLLLGLPILLTLGVFVRDVRRRFREAPKEGMTYWLRVGAVIGLLSIATQSLVEFSLQMPGNAALFAVLAGIALHQSPNLREHARLT
jgi:O-antigen ligase